VTRDNKVRQTLKRLIDEAAIVAPSIRHFDVDRDYGRVTDEDLDTAGQIRFEVEADATLSTLVQTGDARYQALSQRYQDKKREALEFHSKSIWVRETQQFLKAAFEILDTDAANTPQPSPDEPNSEQAERPTGIDPPPPAHLAVLAFLWRASLDSRALIDAPLFLDDHANWEADVDALEKQRYLAREGDSLRLTARGLCSLDDEGARDVLLLGNRIHSVLHATDKNPSTRGRSIPIEALARMVGAQDDWFRFALEHLRDALTCWCVSYTPVFTQPEAVLQPGPGVRKWRSVEAVARQLQTFAREYGVPAPAVPPDTDWISATGIDRTDSTSPSQSGRQSSKEAFLSEKSESTADRWIRALKNNQVIAALVVFAVIVIGLGAVAGALKSVRDWIPSPSGIAKSIPCSKLGRVSSEPSVPAEDVNLAFINDSGNPVQVGWIDEHAKARPDVGSKIPSTQEWSATTSKSHVWLISSKPGACVGIISAGSADSIVKITNHGPEIRLAPVREANSGAAGPAPPPPPTTKWKIRRVRPDSICEGRWTIPATDGIQFPCPLTCWDIKGVPFLVPGNDSARCTAAKNGDQVTIDYSRAGSGSPAGDASCTFTGTRANDQIQGDSQCLPADPIEQQLPHWSATIVP